MISNDCILEDMENKLPASKKILKEPKQKILKIKKKTIK